MKCFTMKTPQKLTKGIDTASLDHLAPDLYGKRKIVTAHPDIEFFPNFNLEQFDYFPDAFSYGAPRLSGKPTKLDPHIPDDAILLHVPHTGEIWEHIQAYAYCIGTWIDHETVIYIARPNHTLFRNTIDGGIYLFTMKGLKLIPGRGVYYTQHCLDMISDKWGRDPTRKYFDPSEFKGLGKTSV